ncbi:hypothetical protein E2542_SST02142 [Spatholobus suberectus]|nr:hypothetical protein E2542_SST02142 [Spatholobus suberectus]
MKKRARAVLPLMHHFLLATVGSPLHSPDKNEYLLVFSPGSSFNVFPQNPPRFWDVLEEMFVQMKERCAVGEHYKRVFGSPYQLLEGIHHDRSWDSWWPCVTSQLPTTRIMELQIMKMAT